MDNSSQIHGLLGLACTISQVIDGLRDNQFQSHGLSGLACTISQLIDGL